MDVSLRLLGKVNDSASPTSTVRERYIAAVTAEALSSLMAFERAGVRKSDRFRIRKDSFIQVDEDIQRGKDVQGNLLQIPAKVTDIATTLLGESKNTPPTAFLGTLIWNVRPEAGNTLQIVKEEVVGNVGPPSYLLRVRADHVWLTDSVHRHLGIVQAYRWYQLKPDAYPRFRPNYEFVVEIYNLDKAAEKALFFELNALQKRITAAKRKEMDAFSSAGFVKDAIREYDESANRLFIDNIEVTAVQNINHTLMTMSLFVSSIHEMFPKAELDEGKLSAQKRGELAEYYCNFFYQLRDTIAIEIDDPQSGAGTRTIKPFYNLYAELIQPIDDEAETADLPEGNAAAFEARLEAARSKAKALNALVRSQDIANSNTSIKALCRIARIIRPMSKWQSVIDYLQTGLNLPAGNRFFQASNPDLMAPPASPTDVQIIKRNDDGTINIQVQSQTIGTLYRYLRRKLQLDLPNSLRLVPDDPASSAVELPAGGAGGSPSRVLSRSAGGTTNIEAIFFLAGRDGPEEGTVRLGIKPADPKIDWDDLVMTGTHRLQPTSITRDEGYEHPLYGKDISRYVATFEFEVGKAPAKTASDIELSVTLHAPDLESSIKMETEARLRLILS